MGYIGFFYVKPLYIDRYLLKCYDMVRYIRFVGAWYIIGIYRAFFMGLLCKNLNYVLIVEAQNQKANALVRTNQPTST